MFAQSTTSEGRFPEKKTAIFLDFVQMRGGGPAQILPCQKSILHLVATEFIAGAASWAFLGASARRSVGLWMVGVKVVVVMVMVVVIGWPLSHPLHLVDGEGALRRLLLVTSAPVDLHIICYHKSFFISYYLL